MPEPRVPGGRDGSLSLPCGETISVADLDMGLREFRCECGDEHAVVTDAHPLGRFVPESIVEVLEATVKPAEGGDFETMHMMGIVMEEFPEDVVAEDTSEDGSVGYGLVWVSTFDARRLHEIVVELIVELMDHAISHAEDDEAASEFERRMGEFDVGEFVERYRREREFEDEFDTPA